MLGQVWAARTELSQTCRVRQAQGELCKLTEKKRLFKLTKEEKRLIKFYAKKILIDFTFKIKHLTKENLLSYMPQLEDKTFKERW